MPPTLEEVVYDLARAALDEQRELVANLRASAAPLLAVSGALENRRGVVWMRRCLVAGLMGVVLELVGFGLALAIH
jgi:hypothetical protein